MAGGNFGPNIGGIGVNSTSCEDLIFSTNITTPEENLFNDLKIEEVLDVKLTDNNKAVGLFNKNGIVIGSIVDPEVLKLIKCLKDGKNFIAVIKEIQDAYIEVLISYKRNDN